MDNNQIKHFLFKFDLYEIPENTTITSVTLSMCTTMDLSNIDRKVNVYCLKRAFIESETTCNIAPTGLSWQMAGASGTDDRDNTSIGLVDIPHDVSLNTEKQIPLSATTIQQMFNRTFTNNGFIIDVETKGLVIQEVISHLRTNNEFYTKMDEAMTELKTIREGQTLQSQHPKDQDDKIEKSSRLSWCSFGAVGMEIMDLLDGMDENRPIL